MSYLPIDEETNTQGPTGQTTNLPGQIPGGQPPPQSGGSTGTTPSGPAATPAVGSASGSPTQFGSSASKLGDYLSANAPQIQNQANTLTGNLNTQYGNLNQGITDAANNFQSQVQGGYATPNQGAVDQAVANPAAFASDPNNVKAFQGQYNDTYTGPTNFEGTQGYSDLQNQVAQGVTQGNLLNSPAGLQTYLQGQGTNPTKASSTLDALLMQGNPAAQAQIQQAAGQFGNLTGQLGTATTNADQSVTAAQQAAQAAQAYAQGQYGNAVTGFNANLQNELGTANTANANYNTNIDALRSQLQSGNLSGVSGIDPGLLAYLNNTLTPYQTAIQGSQGYNMPAANYVNALPSNINPQVPQLGQVASSQDYATLAALGQLGGSPISSPLSSSTAAQAGTYQAPVVGSVNNQALAQDMLSQLQGTSGNVNIQQFKNANDYQQQLERYLGGGDPHYGQVQIGHGIGQPLTWENTAGFNGLAPIA